MSEQEPKTRITMPNALVRYKVRKAINAIDRDPLPNKGYRREQVEDVWDDIEPISESTWEQSLEARKREARVPWKINGRGRE